MMLANALALGVQRPGGGVPTWLKDIDPDALGGIDFANDRRFGMNSTFARSSAKYARTVAGVYMPFANDVLARTDRGARIGPSATNLMQWSADVGNAAWGAESGLAKSALVGGPISGQNATRLTWTTGNGRVSQVRNFVSGTVYRRMAIVRAGATARYACFRESFTVAGGTFDNYVFDLVAGSVGYQGAGSANAGIIALTGNWKLIFADLTAVENESIASYFYVCNNPIPNGTFVPPTAGQDPWDVAYNDLVVGEGDQPVVVSGASAATYAADDLDLTDFAGTKLRYTFDNDTTQEVTGVTAPYQVPTNLNRRVIKSVVSLAA
jgi:hypothetical protein